MYIQLSHQNESEAVKSVTAGCEAWVKVEEILLT